MAFNSRFDGLDLTPAFIFPENQSYGNHHPFRTSDNPLAEPRQPVSLPNFYCVAVWGCAHYPLQNIWTAHDIIAFDQAGPSQPSVEHQRDPLDAGYASSSLSPAFDMFRAGVLVPYTASHGPLDEISGGPGTRLEVCG